MSTNYQALRGNIIGHHIHKPYDYECVDSVTVKCVHSKVVSKSYALKSTSLKDSVIEAGKMSNV